MIVTEEIKDMIRDGVSLNKIKEKTGIWKSTLYYHYKKIHGRKYKEVIISEDNREEIGEFIGVFAGDGNFFLGKNSCYRVRIYTGFYEKCYAEFLSSFLTKLFSKKPRQYITKRRDVIIADYESKMIYGLICKYLSWNGRKSHTVKLRNFTKLDKKFLKGFLRGLFDTDGGIYRPKNKVAIGTSSEALALQMRKIFIKFGIEPGFYKYKDKDFWYIDIYGSRTDKFMKVIGTHHPNKRIMRQ